MEQPRMDSAASLKLLGGLVNGGLEELGEGLGLHYVDAATFAQALADLVQKDNTQQQAKTVLQERRTAVRTALNDCRTFITVTRDTLKPVFGNRYSANWAQVGFANRLEVPSRVGPVDLLVTRIHGYLEANPTREVAALNVTAARAATLTNALNTALNALASQEMGLKTALNERDAKATLVRTKIRQLTKELTNVLTPLDPRWVKFGLNQPGLMQAPARPEKVSVVLQGNGKAAVKWLKARRANYYRIWIKVENVDTEFRVIGTRTDFDFTIEGLTIGATAEIAVSAVNNGGESARSETVPITVV